MTLQITVKYDEEDGLSSKQPRAGHHVSLSRFVNVEEGS